MRICLVSRTFLPVIGGLERMAHILASGFVAAGHEVTVLTETPPDANSEAPYDTVQTTRHQDRLALFRSTDVVLLMNISLPALLAARQSGTPTVATHQSCYRGTGLRGALLENLKRASMHMVCNISCSNYVAAQFLARSTVIPNSYDESLFAGGPASCRERDFVFCGRFVSDKGAQVAIEAFAALGKLGEESTLTLIGDGPERMPLERLVDRLEIRPNVRFAGPLTGTPLVTELSRHTCMLVPSVWHEPFGIVALEGIAACETVIVSDRGGLPEAAGPCGLVAEPTPNAFATAMRAVLEAKRHHRPIPGAASDQTRRDHLRAHSPHVVVSRYLEVLSQTAARSRRR